MGSSVPKGSKKSACFAAQAMFDAYHIFHVFCYFMGVYHSGEGLGNCELKESEGATVGVRWLHLPMYPPPLPQRSLIRQPNTVASCQPPCQPQPPKFAGGGGGQGGRIERARQVNCLARNGTHQEGQDRGGGGWKKVRVKIFSYPPPLRGLALTKKAGTPCRNFFAKRNFCTVRCLKLHVTFTLLHCMTLAHELLPR